MTRTPILTLAVIASIVVAQAQSASLVTSAARAPRVEFHTFDSGAAKAKVSFHL